MLAKLPSIQLYPADWLRDEIAGCSWAAQGLFVRLMFIMHDAEPYGYLVDHAGKPLSHSAMVRRSGGHRKQFEVVLSELIAAHVLRQDEQGRWHNKRMVEDAKLREKWKLDKQRQRSSGADVHHNVHHVSTESPLVSSSSSSILKKDPPNPPTSVGGDNGNFEVSWQTLEGLIVITVPKGRRVITDADKARLAGKRATEVISFFQSKGFSVRLEPRESSAKAASSGE